MEFNPQLTGSQFSAHGSQLFGTENRQPAANDRATAQDFEAMFVQMSLKEMRPKLEGGIFNHGLAEDVFYQFLDEAIAKEIAQSQNNFGIADAMLEQGI